MEPPLNNPGILDKYVKIDFDDIGEEITLWENALVAYVLGSNPPQSVMEGYFKRIWGKWGID